MARRRLTDKQIQNLTVAKRKNIADPVLAGHYLRVTPNGAKTFACVARDPSGKQHWHTIGSADLLTLDAAREKARRILGAIKEGSSADGPETFATVADDWVKRHLEANGVITLRNKTRYLANHILPVFGARDFRSIRRSDVAKLMDGVSDNAGPAAADEVLSIVRSICSWYATRNDDYTSPIIKGMRRTKSAERARDRVLTDDEIRAVWNAAGSVAPLGAIVKLLLLTGQRRTTVASMQWEDVDVDGTWRCVEGPRQKGRGGELILPEMALDVIRSQPRFAHSLYVFPAARGKGHFKAYASGKKALDAAMAEAAPVGAFTNWTLHDLRRTARSLMSRAGVTFEIAERMLGHSQPGVAGIYNRHSYVTEKAQALKALAGLLETILRGPVENVVALRP
jgi:integrase